MVSVITTRRRAVQSTKRKLPLKQYISRPPSSKNHKSKETLRKEKNDVKIARNVVLNNIIQSIIDSRTENSGKTPHKFVQNIVNCHRKVCPWISRNIINKKLAERIKLDANTMELEAASETSGGTNLSDEQRGFKTVNLQPGLKTLTILNPIDHRKKGGRPKGSTSERKRLDLLCIVAAKNEIATKYCAMLKDKTTARLEKGSLKKLTTQVINDRDLPARTSITPSSILHRQKRGKLVTTRTTGGLYSPLIEMEPAVVNIIIQMARIRVCLRPSDGVRLINSMLNSTGLQKKLMEWKRKYSHHGTNISIVGQGYWKSFMHRNKHLIVSSKGQKYELNRANWTTYQNFSQMYEVIEQEMITAGVAVMLPEPVWMNAKGEHVEEGDAFGCKVTLDITKPEMCVVADEVGGNTSQKDDGKIGGERWLCSPGTIPQRKISTKNKHYTTLGLTLLNGHPLMCVVIMAGEKPKAEVETGIDVFAEAVGNVDDDDYFERNTGKGKKYPCGPTCEVRGVTVPCLVRWSPKGGMTSEILRDICATLDHLEVFDRSTGAMPFFLLDGHGSRVELPFLEYINDPLHLWCVCLGVPYGTDLWQVGDSAEQNGTYNMLTTAAKMNLIQKKKN